MGFSFLPHDVLVDPRCFTGADINKADDYGRTPLHVATSADYPEMVRFLIDKGAEVHARTAGEDQAPLHYAAKNEAVQCVKILLAHGADIDARDYKLRTPLQVGCIYSLQSVRRLECTPRGGGGYSSRFWVGVCRPGLQMWTPF